MVKHLSAFLSLIFIVSFGQSSAQTNTVSFDINWEAPAKDLEGTVFKCEDCFSLKPSNIPAVELIVPLEEASDIQSFNVLVSDYK